VKEGITSISQKNFQIGLDVLSERIVIPIRDELGSLIGVKGRLFKDANIDDNKYMYLYSCPQSKILFGLDKSYKGIQETNEVIVVEAEKSVIKLNALGYNNAVAIGSKNISNFQVDKLLRLNVPITLALDKDVSKEEIDIIINELRMPFSLVELYVIDDVIGFLGEKDSPMDDAENWEVLYNNYKFKK